MKASDIGTGALAVFFGTTYVAYKGVESTYKAGKNLYQRKKENDQIKEETLKIAKEFTLKQHESIARLEAQKEQVNTLYEKLKQQQACLCNNQIKRLKRLHQYANDYYKEKLLLPEITKKEANSIENKNFNYKAIMKSDAKYKYSIATGIGTTAGAIGVMSALGSASTGTAIASLHGASAVNATLAAFGGGSIATGGLGIAGGFAALSAIAIVPTVVVAGFLWDKEVRNKYNEALKFKEEAIDTIDAANASYQRYSFIYGKLLAISFITTNIKRFLDNLLNEFEKDIITDRAEDSMDLIDQSAKLVDDTLSLTVVTENNKINNKLEYEIKALELRLNYLQCKLGYKIISKDMPLTIEYMDYNIKGLINEEIRQYLLDTFDKAKKEICIISPHMTSYAVNAELQAKMYEALKRGVKIKILYGLGVHVPTTITSNRLRNRFQRFNNFSMKETYTHAKLLICDNKYYIMGSYNFLSFDGDYSSGQVREEISNYSEDPNMIKWYKDKFFQF